jgi:hypothetical protein
MPSLLQHVVAGELDGEIAGEPAGRLDENGLGAGRRPLWRGLLVRMFEDLQTILLPFLGKITGRTD